MITKTGEQGLQMAELTINADDVRNALNEFAASYEPGNAERVEVGRVTTASDGIARVEGLPSVRANELLRFEDGTLGLAQNLDVREIGVIILGDFYGIEEGQEVHRTGQVLSVPVGDAFLGRVVDPLGVPIDDLGEIKAETTRALELQAPGVTQRKSVHEPMQTGLKAIDAMIPIGRGQRQLIIGDRQTGEDNGALEYTTIVASPASDPAGFKYLAPYAGSAIGQHWMYGGKHVLIVFDDLSKQAEAYRAVSLLLRRPPGREAYPGDVIYLETGLFNSGVRPAINVGVSVSRVGGNAQIKAMKTVAGSLRLNLAQYRELEAFSAFGSDLDKASQDQLARGAQLVELLKQPQYSPYPVEEEVVSIWAGTTGELDVVPVADIRRFEREFLDYVGREHRGIYDAILQTGKLDDDTIHAMKKAIAAFKQEFQTSEGKSLVVNEPEVEAMEAGDVGQETVKRYRPPRPAGNQ